MCKHTDEITGTWTTIKVNKALEKGYKITEVYAVWHFEQKSNELFRGYIRGFIKIKLETSPWTKYYKTKEEYATVIKDNMGIDLYTDKIEDNPGKSGLAKICLNSLWGKFGQRLNMTQTKYVTDPCEFY